MPLFTFEALSATGESIQGTLDATSRSDAYRQIEARQLAPVEIAEQEGEAGVKNPAIGEEGPLRLKKSHLIFFTSELADLIDAGLPVQQALNVMADRQQDPIIRKTGNRLRHFLRDGETLAACFRQTSSSFDDLYISLISAGETSGTLAGVLHRMAQSLTQLNDLRRRFVAALVYPAFMIGACALLMGVFVLVLVPQLTSLLSKTAQELPAITQMLLGFSGFCTSHLFAILGGAFAVVICFRGLIATKAGRLWWDRFKMKIPLIGPIIETSFYASFTQALGNLVSNGVPLLSSLNLLAKGTTNRFFRQRLSQVVEAVSSGDPLSTSLRSSGNFQPLMTDIIAVGEQTSHLARALQKAAARYDKELDVRIKRLTALISPAIITFLAVVVTIIAYCIVSSIFSAVSGIRAQTG